jgi:hypothetical protein
LKPIALKIPQRSDSKYNRALDEFKQALKMDCLG